MTVCISAEKSGEGRENALQKHKILGTKQSYFKSASCSSMTEAGNCRHTAIHYLAFD